jgi:hypothetical protein
VGEEPQQPQARRSAAGDGVGDWRWSARSSPAVELEVARAGGGRPGETEREKSEPCGDQVVREHHREVATSAVTAATVVGAGITGGGGRGPRGRWLGQPERECRRERWGVTGTGPG